MAIISPEEARVKAPPTPPSRIVASRPTTERAEPKLALENAAETTLEPAALQLTTLACLYFFATARYWPTSLFIEAKFHLPFAF